MFQSDWRTNSLCRPVTFDLSHVSHSSYTEPEVLSVKCSGNGAGNGGLPYTRRAIETQDLPLGGTSELAHCNELLHTHTKQLSCCDQQDMEEASSFDSFGC